MSVKEYANFFMKMRLTYPYSKNLLCIFDNEVTYGGKSNFFHNKEGNIHQEACGMYQHFCLFLEIHTWVNGVVSSDHHSLFDHTSKCSPKLYIYNLDWGASTKWQLCQRLDDYKDLYTSPFGEHGKRSQG